MAGPTSSRIDPDIFDKCANKSRNGICYACKKLKDIERRIEDARTALDRLLNEKEQLTSVLNEHHDPFVHRLPVEITSRIFTQYQQALVSPESYPYISLYDNSQRAYLKALLTLDHICHNWCRIARATSELWTFIFFTVTPSNCVLSAAIAIEWLERSKGLPLFIGLHMRRDSLESEYFVHFGRTIVEAAIRHAQRWEVLDLWVPSSILTWVPDSLSATPLAQLNHLKLDISGHQHDNTNNLHLQASPRYLKLLHVGLGPLSIDFGNLTSVTARAVSLEESMLLLSEARQLLFCQFLEVTRSITSSQGHTQNSSLHTLNISHPTDGFWNHFTFPSLRILQVEYPYVAPQCWTHLQGLLRRSDCKIVDLRIQEGRHDQFALVDVLRLTPDLERLSIDVPAQLFSHIVSAATSNESGQPASFLRKLASLNCTTVDLMFDFSWLVTFLATMTSRRNRSLQSFEFQYQDDDGEPGPLIPKRLLKHLMDALHGLEFKLLDDDGEDLVESMCQRHSMPPPLSVSSQGL